MLFVFQEGDGIGGSFAGLEFGRLLSRSGEGGGGNVEGKGGEGGGGGAWG